jgi:hypothetical protein
MKIMLATMKINKIIIIVVEVLILMFRSLTKSVKIKSNEDIRKIIVSFKISWIFFEFLVKGLQTDM